MYLFTSESVSAGHPDKCADIIADAIVDAHLTNDPRARVAAEVMITGRDVILGGEISSEVDMDEERYTQLVKGALRRVGYGSESGFTKEQTLDPEEVRVICRIERQSPEIGASLKNDDEGTAAGDQGIMFGFACDETEELMPSALVFSRRVCGAVYEYARAHPDRLGIDIKTQVTVDYGDKKGFEEGRVERVDTIVVSAPYTESFGKENAERTIREIVTRSGIPDRFLKRSTKILVNPSGSYVGHGPLYDTGLTGRKLIVDTYGGYAPIGGGAQSGKDWTKVDRSGLYAARWLAKRVVASGMAKKALVQLSYAIGRARPISVTLDTLGTNRSPYTDEELSRVLAEEYPLTPDWIRESFGLDRPSPETFLYADVAARGQVGIEGVPWEEADRKVADKPRRWTEERWTTLAVVTMVAGVFLYLLYGYTLGGWKLPDEVPQSVISALIAKISLFGPYLLGELAGSWWKGS